MRRRAWLWWGLALSLTLVLLLRWSTEAPPAASPQTGAQPAPTLAMPAPTPNTPQDARPPAAAPAPAPPAVSAYAPPDRLGFDPLRVEAELAQRLDALWRRVQSGDAAAIEELAGWMALCEQLSRERRRQARGMPTLTGLPDTDPAFVAWVHQTESRCSAWIASKPPVLDLQRAGWANREAYQAALAAGQPGSSVGPILASEALRRQAAAAGDLAAQLRASDSAPCVARPPAGEDPMQALARRQACQRETLRAVLAAGDPRALAGIPAWSYSAGLGATTYFPADRNRREALWVLAACALGLDCGPSSHRMLMLCLQQGICGYASYAAYAYDYLLSPAGRREVEARLPTLIAAIRVGNVEAILGF